MHVVNPNLDDSNNNSYNNNYAIPGNRRIIDKETVKIEKYQQIDLIPVVLGALGSVKKNFEKYVDKIGIKINLNTVQKTTLLGTARH